jgi:hypothetical protein
MIGCKENLIWMPQGANDDENKEIVLLVICWCIVAP